MRFSKAVLMVFALTVATAALAAQPSIAPSSGVFMMSAHAADAKAAPGKAAKADSDYVGSETCAGCHEDQHKRFKNTVMGKIFANPRTAAEKLGCESCHGAGKAHVEAGGGKETIPIRFGKESKQSAEEQNAACVQCHSKGMQMFWKGSPHEMRSMTCVGCHTVKAEKKTSMSAEARFTDPLTTNKTFTKNSQTELCLQCHQMRRAQLQRSSHMPFREGKVTCTSCHNPHGTPNPKQLIQATTNENCFSCHAERRGPFLWEHPPVMENCSNCHEAHGSTNPQLLKTRMPRLCQNCHEGGGHVSQIFGLTAPNGVTPAGRSTRVINRGCTNCHANIHGSNHPSGNRFRR
jgi:DmsE family decaheme c-type cytochrome